MLNFDTDAPFALFDALHTPDLHLHAEVRLGIVTTGNIWELTELFYAGMRGNTSVQCDADTGEMIYLGSRQYTDEQLVCPDGPYRYYNLRAMCGERPRNSASAKSQRSDGLTKRQRRAARKARRAAARLARGE